MDIRHMNKTHLEHWRGLRKQLWPGHPDDAHLADVWGGNQFWTVTEWSGSSRKP